MSRLLKIVPLPGLILALVAGTGAAIFGDPYVYWVTSGYSQASFLMTFPSEPSEEMFLDALIYKGPLIQEKLKTTQHWKQVQSEGSRLRIKIDNNNSLVISPYSVDRDPDAVFPSGQRIKGIWLTEPSTRLHLPVGLISALWFLSVFVISVLVVLLLQWFWYFLLARLHELSKAIRGG